MHEREGGHLFYKEKKMIKKLMIKKIKVKRIFFCPKTMFGPKKISLSEE